jgi:glycosyltransferase involved in cell wall biosynthesis
MRIAIDCRLIGQSGIGTFIENVVPHMVATPDADFILVGDKGRLADYAGRKNCTVVECTYGSFSPKELLLFPVKEVNKCNVFYTPNFNIPMGIRIPIYCTIHDIVFFDTEHFGSALHLAALKWYVQRALRIAKGVFTVSQFSRQRILDYFHSQRDIQVVCNGLSQELLEYKACHPVVQQRSGIVYLGNIKRPKGIHTLWQAYQKLLNEGGNVPPLTIIGHFDFRTKDDEILQIILANKDKVRLVTDATNQQVYNILAHAACLVSPSLYEGFGIPPLEAMSLGTPVILSDIPVYQEIYGNYPVTFFEAGNADELYKMMKALPASPIDVDELIASTYTYEKTARKIMQALTE